MLACFNVKKTLFFKNYMIVGTPCPVSLFYKVHPADKHSLLWLANWHSALWLAEHQARVGNVMHLSIIMSFSFQVKYKDS